MFAGFVALCFVGVVEAQPQKWQPTEEDCLGLLAVLPTMQIAEMRAYYDGNQGVSGRQLAERLHTLADGGDKDAQFTYGRLLLAGYCGVPLDLCAARQYHEKSRGGVHDWEKYYPTPRWPPTCN